MTVEEKAASIISKVGLWWPLAEQDQLRTAAGAYERVAKAVLAAASKGSSGAALITGHGQHGKALRAFNAHWAQYDGDSTAGLPATAQTATSISKALRDFAEGVDDAKHKITNLAIEIGATLAVGAGLAFFTFGTSAGLAAARTAMLVAKGLAVAAGLSGIAATIAAGLVVVVGAGALEGFISSIVAQVGKTVLSDGDGIHLSEAVSWTTWGAATAPIGLGIGLAARSAFRAVRGGENAIANRLGPANRMGGEEPGPPGPASWDVPEGLGAINPSRSKTNCVNCSIATDDLLAGRGATAAADSGATKINKLERLFGSPFRGVVDRSHLERLLKEAGPGARVIVSRVNVSRVNDPTGLGRPMGHGHVFNGYVDSNGHVRFIDGQTGRAVRVWPVQANYQILWTNKP